LRSDYFCQGKLGATQGQHRGNFDRYDCVYIEIVFFIGATEGQQRGNRGATHTLQYRQYRDRSPPIINITIIINLLSADSSKHKAGRNIHALIAKLSEKNKRCHNIMRKRGDLLLLSIKNNLF